MTAYKVVSAIKKKDVQGKHGPMQVISLGLHDGEKPLMAEWFTKAETQLPLGGTTLEGTLEEGDYGLKFKKAQQGTFGPRPEDPARAARIMRQHSQEMALRYATIRQLQGKLPDTFSLEDLFKIADRFDADGQGAAA